MCGRYVLENPAKIKKRFSVKNKLPLLDDNYNVAPSFHMPIITKNSPNQAHLAKWGYLPPWELKKAKPWGLINIRSETTKEKPFFQKLLMSSRCLIPATGFYEWSMVDVAGRKEKYPNFITLKDQEMFGFAGVYGKYDDAEGRPQYYYAILTQAPNSFMSKIHNRQPVILEKDDEEKYLDPEQDNFDKIYKFLNKPYNSAKMEKRIVSQRVGSPKNNDKDLLVEVELNKPFGYGLAQTKIRF